jgi:cytochrome P450
VLGVSRRYASDPFAFLRACERSYGRLAQFDLGPVETYLALAPSVVETVLVSRADDFRKPDLGGADVDALFGDGLLTSDGDTWRENRRRAAPAFAADRLRGLTDRIAAHAERTVEGWSPGQVVDLEAELTRLTLSVICDLMFGVDLPDERIETVREALVPVGRRFELDPVRLALPDWVPTPGDREFAAAVADLEEVVAEIVDRRRADSGGTDLLSILLSARADGDVDRERVRDEVMTTLLAGHDTTALALAYTFYCLSTAPDRERRVREELAAVDGRVGADDVDGLDNTRRVLRESMRLYPPVWVLFRQAERPVELAGYRVPADATVMLSQWATHRSPRYWTDPETFDPDRWRRDRDRPRFAYFPFGGGPRSCVGEHLARLEATVILATVLREYRLVHDGPAPERQATLTMRPAEGLEMQVQAVEN